MDEKLIAYINIDPSIKEAYHFKNNLIDYFSNHEDNGKWFVDSCGDKHEKLSIMEYNDRIEKKVKTASQMFLSGKYKNAVIIGVPRFSFNIYGIMPKVPNAIFIIYSITSIKKYTVDVEKSFYNCDLKEINKYFSEQNKFIHKAIINSKPE